MSYTSLLVNTCSVYRYTAAGTDSYGKPVETWAIVAALTDIACRIMPVIGQTNGVEVKVGAELVIADYQLFLGDVVVTEQDRVNVYWGTTDAWVMYEILLVKDRQDGTDSHHKELMLRTIR